MLKWRLTRMHYQFIFKNKKQSLEKNHLNSKSIVLRVWTIWYDAFLYKYLKDFSSNNVVPSLTVKIRVEKDLVNDFNREMKVMKQMLNLLMNRAKRMSSVLLKLLASLILIETHHLTLSSLPWWTSSSICGSFPSQILIFFEYRLSSYQKARPANASLARRLWKSFRR